MKRLSLIDSSDKEHLLLRNPANYKSGFWVSYLLDGECIIAESTEELDIYLNPQKEINENILNIQLQHAPRNLKYKVLDFSINVWSYNKPIMLISHSTSNLTNSQIKDVKLYFFMDFDIGGPRSYKDDFGAYDPDKSLMTMWDESCVYVDLTSKPKPDNWDIAPPVKLKVTESRRDLQNNLNLGPKDIATALQWNLGDLDANESKSIRIVLTSAQSSNDAELLIPKAWELFDKIQ